MRPSGAACRPDGRPTALISSSDGHCAAGRDGLLAPQRRVASRSRGLARCSSIKDSLSAVGCRRAGRPASATADRRTAMRLVPAITARRTSWETAHAMPTLGGGREGRSCLPSMRVTAGRPNTARGSVRPSIRGRVVISMGEAGSIATASRISGSCLTIVVPCGIASARAFGRSPRSPASGRTSRSTGWSSIRISLASRGPVAVTLASILARSDAGRAGGLRGAAAVFSTASAVQGRSEISLHA